MIRSEKGMVNPRCTPRVLTWPARQDKVWSLLASWPTYGVGYLESLITSYVKLSDYSSELHLHLLNLI